MSLLLERAGPFVLFPVVHYSYEFTLAAAQAFVETSPAAVALEYPRPFENLILQGIRRLPKISVLVYGDPAPSYVRIEPVDPFIEAARLALSQELPVHCIDLALPFYPDIFDPLPDAYALQVIGHEMYCREALKYAGGNRVPEDEIREAGMAYNLQQLAEKISATESRPILVLCGLSHLEGLKAQLSRPQPKPFQTPSSARLFHLSPNSIGEILGTFPFLTAVYELQRNISTDNQLPEPERVPVVAHDASGEKNLRVLSGNKPENQDEFAERQHRSVAGSVDSDRRDLLHAFLLSCRDYYEFEIGDKIHAHAIALLDRFARKYAAVKQMLLPGFYELLIAARSCVSSHFCYRMWQIGICYPAQNGASELEVIELRAENLFPFIRKVRMNPHPPLKPRSALPRFLRRNEKQRIGKQKDLEFHPFTLCSYQPEDLTIENYGQYLRKKGKNFLSEERKRVQPFETSLLDGIDLRETIRNWHTGNIYVQECRVVKGGADSIVVVFDEDTAPYPYTMTWLGEHHQESDMAFYATDPEERAVGPGIRKAIYGGFLMTMPPGRLFDVFHDPAYGFAQNHAERLLLAGIDYGLERFVMYAAPKPPRPLLQAIAGRYGKRILYIPLAQLSPVMLRKIRTFHILADKSVRDYARDYIW